MMVFQLCTATKESTIPPPHVRVSPSLVQTSTCESSAYVRASSRRDPAPRAGAARAAGARLPAARFVGGRAAPRRGITIFHRSARSCQLFLLLLKRVSLTPAVKDRVLPGMASVPIQIM